MMEVVFEEDIILATDRKSRMESLPANDENNVESGIVTENGAGKK